MRASILILFLTLSVGVKAQLNYKTVDSTSYALYSKKQWEQLAVFGDKVSKEGIDYYYLNLRIGIANYELGRFYIAEQYFNKAQEKNSAGKVAIEYLFWIYNQTDREPEAAEMFELMSDSIQESIDYRPKRMIESVYLEVGPKFSNNADASGTLLYGNIGFKHQFSSQFNLYHSYTSMQNELAWGDYQQHQYYIAPTLNLKKAWQISIGFNYFQYNSNIDYNYQTREPINSSFNMGLSNDTSAIINHSLKGEYSLSAYLSQLNLSKTIKSFSFKPQIGWYSESNKNKQREFQSIDTTVSVAQFGQQVSSEIIGTGKDTVRLIESGSLNHIQYGIGLDYTHRYSKKSSLTIGSEFHSVLINKSPKLIIAPYFSVIISKKFGFSGYYMTKGNYPVSLFGGSTVINSYDRLNHRISLTSRVGLSQKTSLYTTFLWEDIEDNFSLEAYKSYSILIGIKIKF